MVISAVKNGTEF